MRRFFQTTALTTLMLLALVSTAGAQVSFGIRIGPPPPPRVVRVVPVRPGPEFVWVAGYWYPVGNHYRWHDGYWTRPPYGGAYWVTPRYEGYRYYGGYWAGSRGRFDHEHGWDRHRDRDYRRYDRR
jgi:hypothetical protein